MDLVLLVWWIFCVGLALFFLQCLYRIAVALENGLIVPVIRAADEKNVLGLQRSIVDLATRARSRQPS